jgi:hypothetical protein
MFLRCCFPSVGRVYKCELSYNCLMGYKSTATNVKIIRHDIIETDALAQSRCFCRSHSPIPYCHPPVVQVVNDGLDQLTNCLGLTADIVGMNALALN